MEGHNPVRKLVLMFLVLSLAVAGCGFGGDDDDDDAASIDDAETCDDVADYLIDISQDLIDRAEEEGMTSLMSGEEPEFIQEFEPQVTEAQQKADELGCDEEEMTALMNERYDELESEGPVGDFILQMLEEEGFGN